MAARATYDEYQRTRYFPALDGLRALSILLVVAYHMHENAAVWSFLTGSSGVSVFFVLSGFLITTLCLREERDRGQVSLKAFYVRRFYRIFPLYFLVLAVYAVVILGFGVVGSRHAFLHTLPNYVTYTTDMLGDASRGPVSHSWSLGVEEKYYLLWPLLAFVIGRSVKVLRLYGTALLLGGLLAVSFVRGTYLGLYIPILIGCCLAFVLEDEKWYTMIRRVLVTPIAVGIALGFLVLQLALHQVGHLESVYSLMAAALVAVALLTRGFVPRVLSWRPLVYVGRRSYGVYLVHPLVTHPVYLVLGQHTTNVALAAVKVAATFAGSVAVAEVLYRLVEAPLIAKGKAVSRRIINAEQETPAPVVGAPQVRLAD